MKSEVQPQSLGGAAEVEVSFKCGVFGEKEAIVVTMNEFKNSIGYREIQEAVAFVALIVGVVELRLRVKGSNG